MASKSVYLVFFVFLIWNASALADTTITYSATNVPVSIPDGPSGIAESAMEIFDAYEIIDVNVIVTIHHTFDQDLRIYLEAPNEDVVRLANQCGLSGNNYISTVFDDEASEFICDGSPPFTGRYQPDQALTLFDNISSAGTWILRVTDNAPQDVGSIQSWALELTYAAVSARELAPLVTEFSVGQNYPNPFNPTTILPIALSRPAMVSLRVFNGMGQTVLNSRYSLGAGSHGLPIDGSGWSSGSYFAKVESDGKSQTARMVLQK